MLGNTDQLSPVGTSTNHRTMAGHPSSPPQGKGDILLEIHWFTIKQNLSRASLKHLQLNCFTALGFLQNNV